MTMRTGAVLGEPRCGTLQQGQEWLPACCSLLLRCHWLLILGGHAVQLPIVHLSWHEQNPIAPPRPPCPLLRQAAGARNSRRPQRKRQRSRLLDEYVDDEGLDDSD